MKIFDSNKNKKWNGKGFSLNGTSLNLLKSSTAAHTVSLKKGKYTLKLIGKKRTGDGKLNVRVKNPAGNILISENLIISSSSWTEFDFVFFVDSISRECIIELSRNRTSYGSVDVGKITIDMETNKQIEASLKLRNRVRKTNNIPQITKMNKEEENALKFNFKNKVAFIIPYGIYGGGEIYIQNIINTMSSEIYDIQILYMKQNKLQNYISTKNVVHRIIRNIDQLSAVISATGFEFIVYYNRADIYELLSVLKEKNIIESKLIEIYHSDFTWVGSLSKIKSRNNIDTIVRVSDSLTNDISEINDKRITIPVGIDVDKFTTKNSEMMKKKLNINSNGRPIIGTVARFSSEKNIEYFIDLAKLSNRYYYLLIGSGVNETKIKNLISLHKLSNIYLTGFVKNVEDYYNIFDAFVLPSKIEGTPISIIEAMASGTPVFASNVGAISSIIQENYNGFFLSMSPLEDLNIISRNINNTEVVKRARLYVEDNHNIENTSKKFLNIFSSLNKYFTEMETDNKNLILYGEYV